MRHERTGAEYEWPALATHYSRALCRFLSHVWREWHEMSSSFSGDRPVILSGRVLLLKSHNPSDQKFLQA